MSWDFHINWVFVVTVVSFSASCGALWWRVTRLEKDLENQKEDYDKKFVVLQEDHKEDFTQTKNEIVKLRQEHERQIERLSKSMEEQRKAATDNFQKLDQKIDLLKDGIWQVKETLARMGAPKYPSN